MAFFGGNGWMGFVKEFYMIDGGERGWVYLLIFWSNHWPLILQKR